MRVAGSIWFVPIAARESASGVITSTRLHPIGRVGQVSDVGAGILYLESAPFVTGEILHIDGGQSAGR
jgi:NAD(P)-dependent dehydrogenase (short-subunit alcohol dehydrogenase family)